MEQRALRERSESNQSIKIRGNTVWAYNYCVLFIFFLLKSSLLLKSKNFKLKRSFFLFWLNNKSSHKAYYYYYYPIHLWQFTIFSLLQMIPWIVDSSTNTLIFAWWLSTTTTIRLFSPNYLNNLNSIQKPENDWIWILNTTIRSKLFK